MSLLIISSLILGSSLSQALTSLFLKLLPFPLFLNSIPSVDDTLVFTKTFDFVDFIATFFISLVLFLMNYFILKFLRRKSEVQKFSLAEIFLLIFSLLIFIQTHFVTSSRSQVLILIVIGEIIFLALSTLSSLNFSELRVKLSRQSKQKILLALMNGIFLGFYLLLVLNKVTTIALLPLGTLLFSPVVFLVLSLGNNPKLIKALYSFPGPLVLLTLFVPNNLLGLLVVGLGILVVWLILFFLKSELFLKSKVLNFLYIPSLIALFVYNPLFYVGNIDMVEEGYLLGWVERLVQHQALYKDAAAYNTPLMTWGFYLWMKITGFNLFSEKLFFHLLQILGVIFYFFFLKKVLKTPWAILLSFLLFLALSDTAVKNNIEIRLGPGLLSLIFIFNFFKSKRVIYLILAGIFSAISFFTSVEVGIISAGTLLISLNLFESNRVRNNLNLVLGIILGSLVPIAIIFFQGGLGNFVEQISFYSKAFSQGYFNVALERSISTSYFHFHLFNQYLSSNAFFWEIARLILFGSFIFLIIKFLKSKKEFEMPDKFILTTTLFGLLLFRTALGRSDWYHLLFVLPLVIAVLFYFLERVSNRPVIVLTTILILFLLIARVPVNSVFLENQAYKLQTFGKLTGEYKQYSFNRGSGILMDVNTNTNEQNELVSKIQHYSKTNDKIFTFPWMPELYFYADRMNATSIDVPYSFYSEKYQNQMVTELANNNPEIIVYNKKRIFGGLTPDSLPIVNKFILKNYISVDGVGDNQILKKKI